MMKRFACAALAFALSLTMIGAAQAECTLDKVGTVNDADFVYDSNLLRVRTRDGYVVAGTDGQVIRQEAYANVDSQHGYIVAAKPDAGLNCFGAFDAQGSEVMPFAYGDVKFLSPDWALGFKLVDATAENYDYSTWGKEDVYYLIDTVDVYSVQTGKLVASLPRANYKDADEVNGCINIEDRASGTITTYDKDFNALGTVDYTFDEDFAPPALVTYRENGQYGLKDAAGNVVMAPSFYTIYDFRNGYATVSTGEKEGLIDEAGNVVVPAQFDDVKSAYTLPNDPADGSSGYNAAGYFGVVLDGKLGFVNAQGEVTCEPKLSDKLMEFNGASATYTDMEGKVHILAADGVDTVVEGYDRVRYAEYMAGMLYTVTDSDYNYGVIDWHGNVVLPCTYQGVSFSADGRYMLADVSYDEAELYEVTMDGSAPAAQPAAAPADNGLKASIASKLSAAPAAPAAPEAPAADNGNAAVVTLLESAAALLDADAASAAPLLTSAATLLGADHPASALLTSAATLLNADAAANAASVKTLVETAKGML